MTKAEKLRSAFREVMEELYAAYLPHGRDRRLIDEKMHVLHVAVHEASTQLETQ